MAWTICDHLGSATTCMDPGTDGIRICVCTAQTSGYAVVRLKRCHGPAHGQLVPVSAPSGVAAAFRLEHDTTTTQPTSTLYSPPFVHPGKYPYTIQVLWSGGTRTVIVPDPSQECQEEQDAGDGEG